MQFFGTFGAENSIGLQVGSSCSGALRQARVKMDIISDSWSSLLPFFDNREAPVSFLKRG